MAGSSFWFEGMRRLCLLSALFLVACRVPDYKEVENLVQTTRYLSAARFDKEFHYRKHWAIAGVNPKFSEAAKLRWTALQNAVWDFQSFHQSFFEVTLEQADHDFWEKPLAFYDSKSGKKLIRSLDIYYEHAHTLWREYREQDITPARRRLLTELYFIAFDAGLEEEIARLLNPLFTEAAFKVEHGRLPEREDEKFEALVEKNLQKELQRLRRLERKRQIHAIDLRDLSLRLTLLTDDDLTAVIREQQKPENTDMAKVERIALAESMALQLEDFLAEPQAESITK